jgi:tight adherence protein B
MRRAALIVGLLGIAALGGAPAHAAEGLQLTPTGSPQLPDHLYRLAAPTGVALRPGDISVAENGDPVRTFSLTAANGRRVGAFGSVLVIDTSSSMRGKAIKGAVAAARILAHKRTGAQQLGIVLFNGSATVLLDPTADPRAIDAALAHIPALAPQTHIFDAVDAAITLLERKQIAAGSVVVLSDGSDTGSATSAAAVAQRAARTQVRIYTVGLRSGAFDPGELKGLANTGGGRYFPAESASDLARIFRGLGTELASEYLIGYRSSAPPGSEVTVSVRMKGIDGIATSSYVVPGDATFIQVRDTFWTSTLGIVATALLFGLLLAVGLAIVLVSRQRGPGVRERIGGFVSSVSELVAAQHSAEGLTGRKVGSAERSLERTRWWGTFKRDVELARIDTDPFRIVAVSALATLILAFLLSLITPLICVLALAVPWGTWVWVRVHRDRQRQLFADQLPDMLQGAASAIRAGHGLVGAFAVVADDAPEPSRSEFLRIVADEQLGVPLDDALRVVQVRMVSTDVQQIALVAQIQREAGGNMAEVLDRVTEALRQRAELRRMIRGLTAQGRMSRWVVSALPVVLLLAMTILVPDFSKPLFTTGWGIVALLVALTLVVMGSLVIKRIVDFKV